jgi:hypothetical protein
MYVCLSMCVLDCACVCVCVCVYAHVTFACARALAVPFQIQTLHDLKRQLFFDPRSPARFELRYTQSLRFMA